MNNYKFSINNQDIFVAQVSPARLSKADGSDALRVKFNVTINGTTIGPYNYETTSDAGREFTRERAKTCLETLLGNAVLGAQPKEKFESYYLENPGEKVINESYKMCVSSKEDLNQFFTDEAISSIYCALSKVN